MRSSVRILDCFSCTGNDKDAEQRRADLQRRILRELCRAIMKAEKGCSGMPENITVHVCPRRFQAYGWLQVFSESSEGEYRLTLPLRNRIVSDRNVPKNCFFVKME